MAYTKNTLSLLSQVVEGSAKKWIYLTADSLPTVLGAGYISNAGDQRMMVGDIVEVLSGTLTTVGLTEAAAVFSPVVGAEGAFSGAPQYMLCMVSGITAGAATLVEVANGSSTSSLVGFFGATPISQPTSASEAAVSVSTPVSACGVFGFSTSAQPVAIITLVNQLRADLVALGLIKGS